jgi:hypothetical protein
MAFSLMRQLSLPVVLIKCPSSSERVDQPGILRNPLMMVSIKSKKLRLPKVASINQQFSSRSKRLREPQPLNLMMM